MIKFDGASYMISSSLGDLGDHTIIFPALLNGGASPQVILSTGAVQSNSYSCHHLWVENGKIKFTSGYNIGGSARTWEGDIVDGFRLIGLQYHFSDHTDTPIISVDGETVALTGSGTATALSSAPYQLCIGLTQNVSDTRYFTGAIGDIHHYNVALTEAELNAHTGSGLHAYGYLKRPAGLQNYWPMNEIFHGQNLDLGNTVLTPDSDIDTGWGIHGTYSTRWESVKYDDGNNYIYKSGIGGAATQTVGLTTLSADIVPWKGTYHAEGTVKFNTITGSLYIYNQWIDYWTATESVGTISGYTKDVSLSIVEPLSPSIIDDLKLKFSIPTSGKNSFASVYYSYLDVYYHRRLSDRVSGAEWVMAETGGLTGYKDLLQYE